MCIFHCGTLELWMMKILFAFHTTLPKLILESFNTIQSYLHTHPLFTQRPGCHLWIRFSQLLTGKIEKF